MSAENIDAARAAWDAWLAGDMERMFAATDPDIVWGTEHVRDWPEGEYRGREGVARFLNEWLEVWDEYEIRLDQLIPAPDGRIVALYWHGGRGRQSGLPLDQEAAQVMTVREGKVTRIDNYDDRAEALEIVGDPG